MDVLHSQRDNILQYNGDHYHVHTTSTDEEGQAQNIENVEDGRDGDR